MFIPRDHWGQVTHICVSKLSTIDSHNYLSPGRCQAITLTIAGILLIIPLGTNCSEILIEIDILSLKNASENIVCRMAAIFSRSKCVNTRASTALSSSPENIQLDRYLWVWKLCYQFENRKFGKDVETEQVVSQCNDACTCHNIIGRF